ncbi:hypothetical protein GCM10023258_18620 [Terrabacter aeriphilus]|uniref:Uncharacterized protein n=1 Tax=Terrabacter aeriphilus TaxID=515662 RepID=A0ABP9JCQ3_9MICO
MTTPDHEEHELQSLLRAHADRVDVPGDFAPGAIARRRRDRRTRATLGAVAAAAVIAVAVPTVWSADRGTPPPVPAVSASSTAVLPSPTGDPTTPQTERATATRDTAYALDDTIRYGDQVIQLEKGTVVESFAVLAGGGFVLQSHRSTGASQSEMEILSPTGRTVAALGTSGMYAVSGDGLRVVAKSGTSDTVVVHDANGVELARRTDPREVAAVVGDLVYLGGDSQQGSLEWNLSTGGTRALPAHVVAVSENGRRAALRWSVAGDAMDEACWAVVDLTQPSFPRTVERCGAGKNPSMFMPTAFSSRSTYLVGSMAVDGGYWFSAGVVRVEDGSTVLGGTGDAAVSGWTWHLADDESSLVISRNTSQPLSPATANTLQSCSLTLDCTELGAQQPPRDRDGTTEPRYVVPR